MMPAASHQIAPGPLHACQTCASKLCKVQCALGTRTLPESLAVCLLFKLFRPPLPPPPLPPLVAGASPFNACERSRAPQLPPEPAALKQPMLCYQCPSSYRPLPAPWLCGWRIWFTRAADLLHGMCILCSGLGPGSAELLTVLKLAV